MVMRLEASEAFILLLKDINYNIERAVEKCHEAEERHLPMYLIVPEGTDLTPLNNLPWRRNGVFIYRHDAELIGIMQKIRSDLKWIRSIGT